MSIRRAGFLGVLAALALPALSAETAAGKWLASVDAGGMAMQLTFDLKTEGEKLTGTMSVEGAPMAPAVITGTVKGEDVAFKADVDMGGQALSINYKGKLKGDQLTLVSSFVMEGAPPNETELVAKRAK